MTRNSVRRALQIGMAVASWMASASLVQAAADPDIARPIRQGEERIEHRLRGLGGAARPKPAAPSSEPSKPSEEAFEPWELVSV